jgi:hypothetical protein
LKGLVFKATVSSHHPDFHGEKFLPRSEIPKLLTEEAVGKELAQCNKWKSSAIIGLLRPRRSDFRKEAKMICGTPTTQGEENSGRKTYQKIFTILALLKKSSLIFPFLAQEVCDDDLPLQLGDVKDTAVLNILTRTGREVSLHGFRRKKSFYDKFIEKQWVALSPYFQPCSKRDDASQTLNKQEIPPFTSWTLVSDTGGFGEVFRVEIHPSHHGFTVSLLYLLSLCLYNCPTNVLLSTIRVQALSRRFSLSSDLAPSPPLQSSRLSRSTRQLS